MDYETQHEAMEIAEELQAYLMIFAPAIADSIKATANVLQALADGQDPDECELHTLRNADWKNMEKLMFEASLQVQRLACTLNPLLENQPTDIA